MTQEMVKALNDGELVKVIAWAEDEQKARADKRKQETLAKIKQLARSIDIGIKIEGTRGRPRRANSHSTK
jgi:hypothetical protein